MRSRMRRHRWRQNLSKMRMSVGTPARMAILFWKRTTNVRLMRCQRQLVPRGRWQQSPRCHRQLVPRCHLQLVPRCQWYLCFLYANGIWILDAIDNRFLDGNNATCSLWVRSKIPNKNKLYLKSEGWTLTSDFCFTPFSTLRCQLPGVGIVFDQLSRWWSLGIQMYAFTW